VALVAKLTTQISVKMEPELRSQVEEVADKAEVSVGSVIREAIAYYLRMA